MFVLLGGGMGCLFGVFVYLLLGGVFLAEFGVCLGDWVFWGALGGFVFVLLFELFWGDSNMSVIWNYQFHEMFEKKKYIYINFYVLYNFWHFTFIFKMPAVTLLTSTKSTIDSVTIKNRITPQYM